MEVFRALQPAASVIVGSQQAVTANMLERPGGNLLEAAFQFGRRQVQGIVVDFARAVVDGLQQDSGFAEIPVRGAGACISPLRLNGGP